jgi:F-type H+-transporting ATPase subunit b
VRAALLIALVLLVGQASPALAQEPAPEGGEPPAGEQAPAPEGQAPEGEAPPGGEAAPPPAPPPPAEEESGNFLVSPNLGLMIWTLLAFGATLLILRKWAFPRIAEALDKRRRTIEDSIEASERTRKEADEILAEYRHRLGEAREQAEDIVARARKAADRVESEAKQDGQQQREELVERARREIQSETQRALRELRQEVADLTVMATERVTRKSLDGDDHRRLVEEALTDLDFSSLAGGNGADSSQSQEEKAER